MIYLNHNDYPAIHINDELLGKYKRDFDVCLINIKREMSRRLVDYTLFKKLQKMYNSFYVIIYGLSNYKYTDIYNFKTDISKFEKMLDSFKSDCKNLLHEDSYNVIDSECVYIVKLLRKFEKMICTNNMFSSNN